MKSVCFSRNVFSMMLLVTCTFLFSPPLDAKTFALFRGIRNNGRVAVANNANQNTLPIAEQSLATPDLLAQLKTASEKLSAALRTPSNQEISRSLSVLRNANNILVRKVDSELDNEKAAFWKEHLQLADLQKTLATAEPDAKLLAEIAGKFEADIDGIRHIRFAAARDALRNYRTLLQLQNEQQLQAQFKLLETSLPSLVEAYSGTEDTDAGAKLSRMIVWLDDLKSYIPEAGAVVTLLRANLTKQNLFVDVSEKMIGAGFIRDFQESFDVRENIDGTNIIGTGNIDGKVTANLVENKRVAEIRVELNANMESNTTGSQGPVVVRSQTSGTMNASKLIYISKEEIVAARATASGNLQTQILKTSINGGKIIKLFAKQQISERQPETQAIAKRRAEQRLAKRVDETVNERIGELNGRYQNEFRKPLNDLGLFPSVWNLTTSEDKLHLSLTAGSSSQLAAPTVVPETATAGSDLVVRLHQSFVNNVATLALAGRTFEEESVVAHLAERYGKDKLPKALQRDSSEEPWTIKFAPTLPVSISFNEDVLKVCVRIDVFKQGNNVYEARDGRGLDITVTYKVSKDGEMTVFEKQEATVFPRGFDQSKDKLGGRETSIISIVKKRLDSQLPAKLGQKTEIAESEWKGHSITPNQASAKSGWITIGWKFD
ncbi:MAG: hypothetical protein LBU65_11045 [Planctomycetaceae bacterium]|jgi:hypothetical protein|nr:hypothetical protein [Planctomycetaceae bacterium]